VSNLSSNANPKGVDGFDRPGDEHDKAHDLIEQGISAFVRCALHRRLLEQAPPPTGRCDLRASDIYPDGDRCVDISAGGCAGYDCRRQRRPFNHLDALAQEPRTADG
jgi:hypothetical protein